MPKRTRLTFQEFVEHSKRLHGDQYDYSEVEYKNTKIHVKIKCKIHGEFLQSPQVHFQRKGCPECGKIKLREAQTQNGIKRRLEPEEFIKRAIEKHGDKYDYSKTNYLSAHEYVTIICKKHGEFSQDPFAHLSGKGCIKCRNEKSGATQRFTTEIFIKRAIEKHGYKYEYSKVDYKNSQTKVIIICKIHGEFLQIPNSHLLGMGCQLCANQEINKRNRMTTEEFVRRAKEINGDFYDYSNTVYGKNQDDKVEIICPEHGSFFQSPTSHLNRRGCPRCRSSQGERLIRNELKRLGVVFEEQKWFPTCKNIKHLYFDFWIPSKNLLIEYDGIQHFDEIKTHKSQIRYFSANLEEVKKRDEIKNKWCIENEIRLERIRYNQNISEKVREILK